ncbi:MAG: CvpA family protein [Gammaproteobacteria bacterium]|nr:CvpA family protein [Gammaproteobacteria bacterium]MCF6230286.1 CvpA family protein [Gammaproteobacteria bacterium]
MIWIDIAILVVLGISVTISLVRGFVRESLSLAGLVAAVAASFYLSQPASQLLEGIVETPSLRLMIAVVVLFVVTLFAVAILNFFVVKLVKVTGLSGTDRMIGVIFGTLRGILVVTVLVVLASMTTLPEDPWWQQSVFLTYFEQLAFISKDYLPSDIAQYIHYN